jgi:hypothetical protein
MTYFLLTTSQIYVAEFYIRHAVVHPRSDLFQDIKDHTFKCACIVAYIALSSYTSEMRELVRSAVLNEIKPALDGDDLPAQTHAKERENYLKKWLKDRNPFSNTHSTLLHLIRAVVGEHDKLADGLPRSIPPQMTGREFSSLLFNMCKPENHTPIQCPLLSSGACRFVISVAIEHVIRYCPSSEEGTREKFVLDAFTHVLAVLGIHNVPWSPPPTGGRGRASHKPTIGFWMNLGSLTKPDERLTNLLLGESSIDQQAALRGVQASRHEDHNIPYSLLDTRWSEISIFFDKTSLPSEWSLDAANIREPGLVKETYEYVQTSYNPQSHLHQIAVLVAFLICKMVPCIFTPTSKSPESVAKSHDEGRIQAAVRNTPWVMNPSNRKGSSAQLPFLTMFSTFIIALYDRQSPLRKYMKEHQGSMGQEWTRKHG